MHLTIRRSTPPRRGSADPTRPAARPSAAAGPTDPARATEAGATSLRLVRLRLILALVAAAVVPLTLAAGPLVRLGQEMHAQVAPAEGPAAAGRLSAELAVIRDGLLSSRDSDPLAATVAAGSGSGSKGGVALDRVAAADTGAITGVWLVDRAGRVLLASRIPALSGPVAPLPTGDARAAALGALGIPGAAVPWIGLVDRPTGTDLYLATRIDGTSAAGPRSGAVVMRISVADLLAQAQTGLAGSVVAYVGRGSRPFVIESSVDGRGAAPGERIAIDVPGFEDWSIAVRSLPVRFDAPIGLILIAVLLGLAAVLLVWWLARQVMKPAEELESEHAHLGRLYETARLDALEDSLTGLGNHRAFQDEFDRQVEDSRRYRHPVSLVIVDLDDFKLVNDSAGHAVGDEMLVEMGRLIRSTVRRGDRVFRIGGDEFAILMPHTPPDAAAIVARRLLAACTEPRPGSRFARGFAFSAGVSGCPDLGSSRGEVFAQADAALYHGKRHGRTSVTIFDPARARPPVAEEVRADLSARVARVVEAGGLRPVYQPIVDLASGRVVGFEGLVRPAPDSGFADAGTLFAAAEQAGRTVHLDRACLETVIRGAARIAPDQMLSLNVSPRSLEAPEFNAGSLTALLARHGVDPGRVTVELTEREGVEDIDRLRTVIAGLQAAGLRVAADDVGAGNSGLRLLSQIHFDIVKIDLSLVQDGELRDSSLAVLRSLVELAQRWGAMVVAEGVETPGQLWIVKQLGMSAAQGYLLGRPSEDPIARAVDVTGLLALADDEPLTLRSGMALAG